MRRPVAAMARDDGGAVVTRGFGPAELRAIGWRHAEDHGDAMPGYGALRRVAIREDVKIGEVSAFLMDTGRWAVFVKADAERPFVDGPLLPGAP